MYIFKARTGGLTTEILRGDANDELSEPLTNLLNENPDLFSNLRGSNLIRFCSTHRLAVLNGLQYQTLKFNSGFTCFPANGGKSTVDYIISDIEGLGNLQPFEIFKDFNFISDHIPIAVKMAIPSGKCENHKRQRKIRRNKIAIYPDQLIIDVCTELERIELGGSDPLKTFNGVLDKLNCGKVMTSAPVSRRFKDPIVENMKRKRNECFEIFNPTEKNDPAYIKRIC